MADPRTCLTSFLETGRNLGRRPPSLSLRNVQRDIRSSRTRIENIGTRIEGAIGAVGRGDFLPGQLLSVGNELRCPPTPYANYFSQHRPPKFKFMFFASLELNPDFVTAFGGPRWADGEVWWFIKQSGRPNVSYEYEDVNMYNFRQKILRRATLEPVSMQMYDDMQDVSHSFWSTFIRIQNPVTNPLLNDIILEESGMNWKAKLARKTDLTEIRSTNGEAPNEPPTKANPAYKSRGRLTVKQYLELTPEQKKVENLANEQPPFLLTGDPSSIETLNNSASTGILPGNGESGIPPFKQIIKNIKLHHIIDWGQKVITYEYVNPRINEIRLDELTWESSEPSVIDVTFEYDTFHIYFPIGVDENTVDAPKIPPVYGINPNSDQLPLPGGLGKVANKIF